MTFGVQVCILCIGTLKVFNLKVLRGVCICYPMVYKLTIMYTKGNWHYRSMLNNIFPLHTKTLKLSPQISQCVTPYVLI